ncbi:MAG: alkaline shock response membrane anchor protein AmaP [Clostridia bacterium]|jgi:uncharacterized alkaline shock family protein YloU|nr:alkaline shock response membrane anchor protein AmaP [Clostridia bacterium]MDH7572665.1 alkaline shock response membrane anchor protein AmaP [Clostridia bacterium]
MGLFERAIAVLYTLVLALAAVILAATAAGWQDPVLYWNRLMASGQERWIVGVLALAVALVGLRALIGMLGTREPEQTLVQSTPAGEVYISLSALEHMVARTGRQVRGIREVRPRVRVTPTGVAVRVEAMVNPDVSVPQVTAELQEKVRRQIEELVGVQVLEVKVLVESVLRERTRVR